MHEIESQYVRGLNGLDLSPLRTFAAVVQLGHLTRAAERLHISQPTASNHIRALENQFGLRLFLRTARGLEPTAAGLQLAKAANRVLSAAAELINNVRALQTSEAGRLSLGTLPDPHANRMPPLISWLRERHPLIELNVEVSNSLATTEGIRRGQLDAGIFVARELKDPLEGIVLRQLDFVVTGPFHWRDRLEQSDWQELAALPWIVSPQGTSNAELCDLLFRRRGLQLNAALEVDNDELMRSLIEAGVGVGFVRTELAKEGEAMGKFSTAPMTASRSQLFFGHSRSRTSDPLIRLLQSAVQQVWGSVGRTSDSAI